MTAKRSKHHKTYFIPKLTLLREHFIAESPLSSKFVPIELVLESRIEGLKSFIKKFKYSPTVL